MHLRRATVVTGNPEVSEEVTQIRVAPVAEERLRIRYDISIDVRVDGHLIVTTNRGKHRTDGRIGKRGRHISASRVGARAKLPRRRKLLRHQPGRIHQSLRRPLVHDLRHGRGSERR